MQEASSKNNIRDEEYTAAYTICNLVGAEADHVGTNYPNYGASNH